MPEHRQPCDVLVVGGGPAAGTAARLLALWGRRVVVAAKPEAADPDLPVSLTPSCGKFFDLMGIRSVVDGLGFVQSTGHTVWWGSAEARVEPFDGGVHGWQAGPARLGRALLRAAAETGATVLDEALTAEQAMAWPAAYRLDCTGRTGVLARPLGGRRYEASHRTVALIGAWEGCRGDRVDPSHTLLESYADGWAWSIPLDARRRGLAVMVDPKATELARGAGARAIYIAEVSKTQRLAELVDGATLAGGPWGWDASMYVATRFTGDGWLLVGDAASAVDPLSSAGVKKAMASAWLAAVAVNTALHDPALTQSALSLFERRETSTYQQFLAMTRHHMAGALGATNEVHPFWSERADASEPGGGVSHGRLLEAFERLKAAEPLRLAVGPEVTIEPRATLGERLITMQPHLVTAEVPEGMRHVLEVDLVQLLTLAPRAADVPALHAAYEAKEGPVEWPSFLTALATAIARKWLIIE